MSAERKTRITDDFVGEWALTRSIADLDKQTTIACHGSATLRRDGGVLAYDEAVAFLAGGKLIRATRAYRYSLVDGTIVAMFGDGTPFFSTRLDSSGEARALHHCGDDLYELALTLRAPNTWATIWNVSGTKRLRITTHYGH